MIEKIEVKGEKIHLKKSFDGWRVVYPIKDEFGNFNWKNFLIGGSFWILLKTLIIILILLVLSWSYARDTGLCRDFVNNPCGYCLNITFSRTNENLSNKDYEFKFPKEIKEVEDGKIT